MRNAEISHRPASAPAYESLQQAAQWFALLRSDEATEQDRVRWRTWIEQRRENQEAWQHVENVSRRFDPLQPDDEKLAAEKALKSGNGAKRARRRALRTIAAVSAISLLGWAIVRQTKPGDLLLAWQADYRTGTGEIREFMLADGTRIWLNTASALNADYRTDLRRLRLVDGEVLIETAQDGVRPFVVETDEGRLHALGTRFTVRQLEGLTYLAVYEGEVEVRSGELERTQIIHAGQQVTFTRQAIALPTAAERAREAWTQGILVADNIPLQDLIAELARYRRGYLGCSPQVAGMRVMGTFPLHDPERALALLEGALPVRIRRTLPWWVSVEAKS